MDSASLVPIETPPPPPRVVTHWRRLSSGLWRVPEGDIQTSYCAETFPKIKVFTHAGRLFANCGGHFSGPIRAAADCYPLVPADEYRGPEPRRYSYEGCEAAYQGKVFKLGPKVVFEASDPSVIEWRRLFRVLFADGGCSRIRRVEDLDSAALTYAEVKAIASGNPLVIEKAQVDAELMRLTRLRSAHAEEQYRIRSNLRHSRDEAGTCTERLTNLRLDITTREDTSGDHFRIEFDGQPITNRGVAGELLIRRTEKLERSGDDVRVGKFAGFDLFIRVGFIGDPDLVVRGKNTYAAKVTDTALGTIRSLESTVQGFEERGGKLEAAIADAQKRAKELEGKVGAAFDREERYHELTRRQGEIAEKLDLTKNQAASQVEIGSAAENEQTISEKQNPDESVRRKRKASMRV